MHHDEHRAMSEWFSPTFRKQEAEAQIFTISKHLWGKVKAITYCWCRLCYRFSRKTEADRVEMIEILLEEQNYFSVLIKLKLFEFISHSTSSAQCFRAYYMN